MQLGRSPVSLADLVRADLLRPGQELVFRKSSDTRARITDAGAMSFGGTDYSSPSTAAKAASGGVSTNGWKAWYVEVGDRRIYLAELRSELLASR